jgi:hypothetical protein
LRTGQVRRARRAPLVADYTAMLLLPFKVQLAGRWLLSVQMSARQKDRGPVGLRPVGAKPEPARGGYDAGPVASSDPNKPGTGLLLTISKDCVK